MSRTDKEAWRESVYSDYREINGLKVPGRFIYFMEGKKYMKLEDIKGEFPASNDEKLFEKP